MRPVKKVALLHDLCGVGKAALTNMVPVLSVMGIEACPIPTILLSTHTGGDMENLPWKRYRQHIFGNVRITMLQIR